MRTIRVIQWIAGIAGLAALTLGLLFWFAQIDLLNIHMLLGLTVALALLVLGIVAICTRGMRLLGVVGIVYALILPVFGLTQATLLIGSTHWLIQVAHMLVGIGGLALMGAISTRFLRLKQTATKASAPQAAR